MYVTMKEILAKAHQGNYAVAAPNVFNFETTRAAISAAVEENSPVIIDINQFVLMKYSRGEYIPLLVRKMAEEVKIPVALNLDHGKDFEAITRAVQYQFTSVMIDASVYPFEENVARTKEVVKIAHSLGITVEAEIGHVGQGNEYTEKDPSKMFTDPEEAKAFVEMTGVDALAIAIGTAHGEYNGTPKIDFDRLQEIKAKLQIPLVLHGGSGTGDDNLAKAAANGINKINLFTDLRLASQEALIKTLQEKPKTQLMELEGIIEEAFKEKVKHYMRILRCSNKA